MKIKTITAVTLMVTIFIGLINLVLNITLIETYQSTDLDSRMLTRSIQTEMAKALLPYQILNNLYQQSIQADDERMAYLADIFQNTQSDLALKIENGISYLDSINRNNNDLPMLRLMASPNHFHSILSKNEALIKDLKELETHLGGSTIKTFNVKEGQEKFSDVNEKIDSYLIAQQNFNDAYLKRIKWISLFLMTMLYLISLLFLFFVHRCLSIHFNYIQKSVDLIDENNYSLHLLKPFKLLFQEEKELVNKTHEVFTEGLLINELVKESLADHYVLDDALEELFQILKRIIGINRLGVAFVNKSSRSILAEYSILEKGDLKLTSGFEVSYDQTSLSELIENPQPIINNNLRETYNRTHSHTLKLLLDEGIQSNLVLPISSSNKVYGFIFFSSYEKNFFKPLHVKLAEAATSESKFLINKAYFTKIVMSKLTKSFATLVDFKDIETGDHIKRMVQYSTLIAQSLLKEKNPLYPVDDRYVLEINRNAASHDIGKVAIPDAILKKPGKLTAEEWTIMKTHPLIGARIFQDIIKEFQGFDQNFFKMAEEITRYHHEKWDGTGYPHGLKGHDIPLAARIIAIADVFDALTSERVYKPAFSTEKSFQILLESKGAHLDPYLVDLFIESKKGVLKIYKSYQPLLNNHEEGDK